MRNETEGAERRLVVRHLLSGCGSCVEVTRRFWRLGEARRLAGPGESEEAESLPGRSRAVVHSGE